MNLSLDLSTGHCNGPLFAPPAIKRPPVRPKGKEGVVHRAQTKRATPVWADTKEIAKIYRYAKRLSNWFGDLYVVDHIVPKIGKTVCGLHVVPNLRIIHWKENAEKGAFWWPDMWMEQLPLL